MAVAKVSQARSSMLSYVFSSVLAGAYVDVAVVLLLMTTAPLVADEHPLTNLVQGGGFGIALTLVVFAGRAGLIGRLDSLRGAGGLVFGPVRCGSPARLIGQLASVWVGSARST